MINPTLNYKLCYGLQYLGSRERKLYVVRVAYYNSSRSVIVQCNRSHDPCDKQHYINVALSLDKAYAVDIPIED